MILYELILTKPMLMCCAVLESVMVHVAPFKRSQNLGHHLDTEYQRSDVMCSLLDDGNEYGYERPRGYILCLIFSYNAQGLEILRTERR